MENLNNSVKYSVKNIIRLYCDTHKKDINIKTTYFDKLTMLIIKIIYCLNYNKTNFIICHALFYKYYNEIRKIFVKIINNPDQIQRNHDQRLRFFEKCRREQRIYRKFRGT